MESFPRRFVIIPPVSAHLATVLGTDVAITPDGKKLVYVAGIGNTWQLYVRPMDRDPFSVLKELAHRFSLPTGFGWDNI